jgi:hypothetical protein
MHELPLSLSQTVYLFPNTRSFVGRILSILISRCALADRRPPIPYESPSLQPQATLSFPGGRSSNLHRCSLSSSNPEVPLQSHSFGQSKNVMISGGEIGKLGASNIQDFGK